jgi:hypothetical protein
MSIASPFHQPQRYHDKSISETPRVPGAMQRSSRCFAEPEPGFFWPQ